ncbi:MAG: HD domain-containing phosphohydrolase [Acidobacteriota bacterium]
MSKAQEKSREETINHLASRIDKFEKYSGQHSQAMSELAAHLARRFGLAESDIEAICEAALLHDIGLQTMMPVYHASPNALRFEERLDLWRHPIIGEQETAKREASRHAQLLVRWHHEWWNGYGYPDMLAYEDIPIGARILRAVELYNALLGKRPYRSAHTKKEAVEILKASAGIECDPYVVHALLALLDEMGELQAPEPISEPPQPMLEADAQPSAENQIEATAQSLENQIEAADQINVENPETTAAANVQPPANEQSQVVFQPTNEAFTNQPTGNQTTASPVEPQSRFFSDPTTLSTESVSPSSTNAPNPPAIESPTSQPAPPTVWQSLNESTPQSLSPGELPQAPSNSPSAPETVSSEVVPNSDTTSQVDASTSAETPQPNLALQAALSKYETTPLMPFSPPTIAPVEQTTTSIIEVDDSPTWLNWTGGSYNKKSLLGFQVSVLRQFQFDSIAIPFSGEAKLDWYLKLFRKRILSNDSRAWAALAARATIESTEALTEDHINQLLEDIYIPGARLTNKQLLGWFRETDAWWLENLHRNIQILADEKLRAQAYLLGMQTGDYALSFNEETLDYRRPLATVFWRLAGRLNIGAYRHPQNRCFNLAPQDFIKQSQVDLLYLDLPAARAEVAGNEARSEWRECWVTGTSDTTGDATRAITSLQSKQAYLLKVEEMLSAAAHIKRWAVGCQDIGLTSAREISELIKAHRPIRATYSKDVAEVAGGLRSYIIIAEKA